MIDAMLAAPGVGLAAPQVGQKLRLIVMRLMEARTPDAAAAPIRAMALVNPEFEALSPELELGWEGCLSVPELRGMVPRYRRIRYRGCLPGGEPVEAEAEGFQARIIQHEIDHLDGIVYLDRMTDLSTLGYGPELLAASAGSRP
jgi:peptide deformylase